MASKFTWKIVLDMLGFLVLIWICVAIVASVARSVGPNMNFDSLIERCIPFVSSNAAVVGTFGTLTNAVHQKKLGGSTWSPESTEGRDVFVVNGTKSNGTIKVHWRNGKQDGFEVLKISIVRPWQDDAVIWTRGNQ